MNNPTPLAIAFVAHCSAALIALWPTSLATAAVVATNLDYPHGKFFTGFNESDIAANSFTTGVKSGILNSATLRLFRQSGEPSLRAFVYDNIIDRPGSVIATSSNTLQITTDGEQDLTFTFSDLMLANTEYWLAITFLQAGSVGWTQVEGPSTGPWSIGEVGYSDNEGETWIFGIPTSSNEFSLDATLAAQPGDFNEDGIVDAADYSVWRDGLGTTYVQADYDVWRDNYGTTFLAASAVPEPTSAVLLFIASGLAWCWVRCV